MPDPVTFTIATAEAPGPIGIIQLHGAGIDELVARLTGRAPSVQCHLVDLGGIDEGLVVKLRDDWCQLMPHGGLRVMQLLSAKLRDLGAEPAESISAQQMYPEAAGELEAEMLAALGRAASPAAIDLLLDQPRRWAGAMKSGSIDAPRRQLLLQQSDRLDRLVEPPSVVLAGQVNVGKSTLTNLVMGRAASITADLPGTTRDWVAGLAELPASMGDLAVRWFDTPGLRRSDDPIEQRAIELAEQVVAAADVLIAVRDPSIGWPEPTTLPRPPDLWVCNKADLLDQGASPPDARAGELIVSAVTGAGLDALAEAVAGTLGLDRIDTALPWAFCPILRRAVESGDIAALHRMTGVNPP